MHSFSDDLVERLKHISAEQMFERGIVSRAKKVGYICPFCRDGTGKDGTGMSTKSLEHGTSWFCGKCNVAYDNIHLLAQYFGKDYRRDFHEVISLAADLFNLQNDNAAAQSSHSATFVPDKYKSFITNANNNLKKFVDAQGGFWRGLSFDTLNKFFCGFNPNCIGMKDEPPLPHVIIPTSFNQYLARLVGKPDDYHIADGIEINLKPHHGQKELFGLKLALNDDPVIFLTEGEIDAMSIHQATGYNVVSVCGAALASNMRTQLKSIPKKNFIVLFDNDETGIKKRDLIVSALQFLNHNAIAADLSDKFKDANDFLCAEPDNFKARLEEIFSCAKNKFPSGNQLEQWQLHNGTIDPVVLAKLQKAKEHLDALNELNITADVAQSSTTKHALALCKFYDCFVAVADKFFVDLENAKRRALAEIKKVRDEGSEFVSNLPLDLQMLSKVSISDIKAHVDAIFSDVKKAHKKFCKIEEAKKRREETAKKKAERAAQVQTIEERIKELRTLPRTPERDAELISLIRNSCDWQFDRQGNPVGIKGTVANIDKIFINDPNLDGLIGFDEFQQTDVFLKPPVWAPNKKRGDEWTDRDDSQLQLYLRRNYGEFSNKDLTFNIITAYSDAHSFHEIKDYFKSLPKWDGKPRAETLFIDWLKVPDTKYAREVTVKILLGAVARIFHPGCEFQWALVLRGNQKIGKGYVLKRLGGKWYKPISDRVDDPHAADTIRLVWIGEFKEMSGMRKADVNAIKDFIELSADTRRFAYARRATTVPRHCVFVITVNDNEFLSDVTGNRRFLILDSPLPKFGYVKEVRGEKLSDDNVIAQIWAEVYHLYNELFKDGFDERKLELSAETELEGERIAETYLRDDGLTTEIKGYLNAKILPPVLWHLLTREERRDFIKNGRLVMLDAVSEFNHRRRAKGGNTDTVQDDVDFISDWLDGVKGKGFVHSERVTIQGRDVEQFTLYGSELRQHICAAEIFNECFGTDKRKSMNRINEILNQLDDWHLGRRLQKVDPVYSEQRKPYYRN